MIYILFLNFKNISQDSNRSNPNEKSNQVSIAGREMDGVEKARARVRELTPLFFTFDLPIMSSLDAVLDPNDAFLRAIQDQYNIQVCNLLE